MIRKSYNQDGNSIISINKTILLLIVTTVLLIGYVWTRIKAIELTYKYSELSVKEMAIIEKNHKLRLELASLISPSRLTDIAVKKLSLSRTPSERKIYMKVEKN
jgi:cell division protein FtsL